MATQPNRLEPYRRHSDTCPHRERGQNYTKCPCPIWRDGERNGKRFRKAVGVRDWARAVKRIQKWEDSTGETAKEKTVTGAIESYLGDCRSRNLKETSFISYRKTLDHLKAFCAGRQVQHLAALDLDSLTNFRSGRMVPPRREGETGETLWPISPSTARKNSKRCGRSVRSQ